MLVAGSLLAGMAAAKCIPIEDTPQKIGANVCVTGKVVKVARSSGGSFFLDFCDDYKKCPFTVVVFPSSLRDVGDVRELEGKTIEISGKIQDWRGRAEIILRDSRQLKGEAAKIPPIPKDYDVQKKGRFSATAPSEHRFQSEEASR
jgi:DNA/RNA endonuclease YhcR with UshA esterase domain